MEMALDCKSNEESDSHEKIELVTMLSMSEEELSKGIEKMNDDVSNMSAALKKMKAIHKDINEKAGQEEVITLSYTGIPPNSIMGSALCLNKNKLFNQLFHLVVRFIRICYMLTPKHTSFVL